MKLAHSKKLFSDFLPMHAVSGFSDSHGKTAAENGPLSTPRPPCPHRPPPFNFPLPLLALLLLILGCAAATASGQVHESVIAGSWYPADQISLHRQIETFLNNVPARKESGRLVALICPHAGYFYSGQVAANAYKLLTGRTFDTVVIVGPSHYVAFNGVSVYDRGGYRTPLGVVPLDMAFIDALKKADHQVRYVASAHQKEHSVEIQLPFLQTVMPGFKLVPLVMGDQTLSTCRRLAKALAACARGKSVLLVASSDLSHYHPRAVAQKLDGRLAERVAAFDPGGLYSDLSEDKCEACGGGPIVSVMMAAQELGADRSEVLRRGDSADTNGDTSRVVGYLAAAFWAKKEKTMSTQEEKGAAPDVLDASEQKMLKKIARDAIASALAKKTYTLPVTLPEALKRPCGAFVTLTKNHRLRGCIGHITATAPLAETVREMALAAAFDDPRFPPLTAEEWPRIDIEVSVLTPLERVTDLAKIRPGVHGLYIRKGLHAGLLLPQVATEYGWDRVTFLEQTCRKAGLGKDDWKDPGAEIYWFKAQVF